jgi:hypothetical protein
MVFFFHIEIKITNIINSFGLEVNFPVMFFKENT